MKWVEPHKYGCVWSKTDLNSIFWVAIKISFVRTSFLSTFGLVIGTRLNCSIFFVRLWTQHVLFRKSRYCLNQADAQREMFQSRGRFVEPGHFDKLFCKNAREKEFFLRDTLKSTFWMENVTQRWTQSRPFFSYISAIILIFKKRQGSPPPLPPLATGLSGCMLWAR